MTETRTFYAADWYDPDIISRDDMEEHARSALRRSEKYHDIMLGLVKFYELWPGDKECGFRPSCFATNENSRLFVGEATVIA